MTKHVEVGDRTGFVAGGAVTGLAAALLLSTCAVDAPEETASSALACREKITICHHTRSDTNPTVTISIRRQAWSAHEKHGDTMGACEPTPPPQPQCGNGVAEGSEECDAADLKGQTCEVVLGSGATGNLTCSADCRLVGDQCQLCGNGIREGTEQCDEPPVAPECLTVPLCAECGPSVCVQCGVVPCDPGPDF